ncbi:MAG TPA: thioredoxin domain-containing protein, partial [Rhodospirillales bacterium]|nr:thioredoxin domain-containing protein [Rhodospirillales bacterium]
MVTQLIASSLIAILLIIAGPARADGERNHMAETANPYLHLHATDPVNWRPWNAETLAEAKKFGKPILLSIGYLSCHWCHVMQRESYAIEATAKLINDNFLPILVDREEMPELDATFQSAAALMGLGGGWPLTMFLTPGGKPFYGGTYFPPQETGGMVSFTYVLGQVIETYRLKPDALVENATAIAEELANRSLSMPGNVTMVQIDQTAAVFLTDVNAFSGGFGDAPLFPMTVAQELLWRAYIRSGDDNYRDAVTRTLDAMVRGGIYDHLGGGFFRYTVDPAWNVPHFEKMLDVNANMVRLMTEVWRETRSTLLARAIEDTVAFMAREMRLSGGGSRPPWMPTVFSRPAAKNKRGRFICGT